MSIVSTGTISCFTNLYNGEIRLGWIGYYANSTLRLKQEANAGIDFYSNNIVRGSVAASGELDWLNTVKAPTFQSGDVLLSGAGSVLGITGSLEVSSNLSLTGAAPLVILNGKEALDGGDAWLRLNQNLDFGSGVFTPGAFRCDGGIESRGTLTLTGANTSGNQNLYIGQNGNSTRIWGE
jgi:hypothetical protein